MRDGRVERSGEIAYFTDADGVRYRIYDVVYGKPTPHKRKRVPLEDPTANTRYFVRELGETRAYTFKKNERRTLDVGLLVLQLAGAGFIAAMPREIGARGPT